MATTSYFWTSVSNQFLLNTFITADQKDPAVASSAAGTRYFSIWHSDEAGIWGRIVGSDGTPVTEEFSLVAGGPHFQGPSVAALPDGRYIATYAALSNSDADIRAVLVNADGSLANQLDIAVGPAIDHSPDVTALADGGFVVSWTRYIGGEDNDLYFSIYNANGSVRHAADIVTVNPKNSNLPSVAGLAGGGFVVAWEEEPAAGGDSEVRLRRFDSAGNPLSGTDATGVLIDNIGDNRDIHVAGLPDGGFVLAYADDGWGNGSDITAQVFNANGTARTLSIQVNLLETNGDQDDPTLTVMPEGYFVVGWRSGSHQWLQAYDANGNALGPNGVVAAQVVQGEFTALDGGTLAHSWSSTESDGSGSAMRSQLWGLQRYIEGDDSNETIISNDGFRDFIYALGGNDTVDSGAGDDAIYGGTGNDTINGGSGLDTAVFSQSLHNFVVQDLGSRVLVAGPDGFDTLFGIERLQFTDGTLVVADDGNALFDTLFYLSRNTDAFHAGVDALDHFNTFGRHEGRDPNIFFDTSGYLAVNKDVAASGANPLDHYHQFGWREGRDPSAAFDTALYLIHNPDVAAAGVDPLEHFLQFGRNEGRSFHLAVGSITDGFDAQRYLFFNPDVAAAGVDPLEHFNTFGWHEGRNPNGYFDTAGYLAHYADVAAAGVNPLEHYAQFGWKEGRDPSSGFDTLGYLAANPDVAAANVNPLDHFLMFGIYEGRQAINDGIWH